MIKRMLAFSVLMLIICQSVFAVEFTLNPEFKQGETIIAKISGNFVVPLSKSNVFFYKEHVRIPVEYGIEKMGKEYYLYASLEGKSEGNYSVSLEDIQYREGTATITSPIVKNFSITNETADFSLKPGAILSSGDFSVELQNLKSSGISVNVNVPPSNASERDISVLVSGDNSKTASIFLVSGEVEKMDFTSAEGLPTFQFIVFSSQNTSYNVPVYIFSALASETQSYKLEPLQLVSSLPANSESKKTIILSNEGSTEIRNISISLSDSIKPFVNLSVNHIESLSPNSNVIIELSIFSAEEKEVSGTLKADINGEEMLYSQISLIFLQDYIPVNDTQSSEKTCSELNGRVCSSGEACDKQILYTSDSVWCCLGNCKSTGSQSTGRSSAGIVIAIILFIAMAGVIFWFYKKKYGGAKKAVDLLKVAKGEK